MKDVQTPSGFSRTDRALFTARPAGRRHPGSLVGTGFVRSIAVEHLVSSRLHVQLNLIYLLVVEELVPRLHTLVGSAVANNLQELCGRKLLVRVDQVRCVRRSD